MNPAEQYILEQPEPYRSMLLHLQLVITHTIPNLSLKYKYKVPFYYLEERPYCYLNVTKDYVDVGFWKGIHISTHTAHLTVARRRTIRSLRYKSITEINDEVLIAILKDAYTVRNKKYYI